MLDVVDFHAFQEPTRSRCQNVRYFQRTHWSSTSSFMWSKLVMLKLHVEETKNVDLRHDGLNGDHLDTVTTKKGNTKTGIMNT